MTTRDDHAEISDLVSRLGMCLDEGRFEGLRDIVTENAQVHTPGGQAEGRDALIAQAQRNHPGDQRFQHVITNVLVDVDGDRAAVRANLIVHATVPGEATAGSQVTPLGFAIGEVYHFEVVRTADGWRFARIETVPLWLSGTLPRVA